MISPIKTTFRIFKHGWFTFTFLSHVYRLVGICFFITGIYAHTNSEKRSTLSNNFVVVNSVTYDSITHTVSAAFSLDTVFDTSAVSILIGQRNYLKKDSLTLAIPQKWTVATPLIIDSSKMIDTLQFYIGNAIVFDTLCFTGIYCALQKKGDLDTIKPTRIGDSASMPFRITSFNWQIITFANKPDTLFCANRRIIVQCTIPNVSFTDTLKRYTVPDSGIKYLSGFVAFKGIPFFNFNDPSKQRPPFKLGIDYSGVSSDSLILKKIGIYAWKNGTLNVFRNFTKSNNVAWLTITLNDVANPFFLLADTTKPIVRFKAKRDTIPAMSACTTIVLCKDNCDNVTYIYQYNHGYSLLDRVQSGFLGPDSSELSLIIGAAEANQVVHPTFGFRSELIVSDGINIDTIVIAPQVSVQGISERFSTEPLHWVPLRIHQHLDTPQLSHVFAASQSNPALPWVYDIYSTRLYVWGALTAGTTHTWLEYSEATKLLFVFNPGSLVWCKTSQPQTITFGSGVSLSLNDSFSVVLSPKNWTDFTNPYQFPVLLKDVVAKRTGFSADSLAFYHWKRTESALYNAQKVFIGAIDDLASVTDTLQFLQKYDAYTVYNSSSAPIQVKIPPIPPVLSKNRHDYRRDKEMDEWLISFEWHENTWDRNCYSEILCAYNPNQCEQNLSFFGPLPPSMSKIVVGLLDTTTHAVQGWNVFGSMPADGIRRTIAFTNNSSQNSTVYFRIRKKTPNTIQPAAFSLYDPNSMHEVLSAWDSVSCIDLKPLSTQYYDLLTGSDNNIKSMKNTYVPLYAHIKSVYPNPFSRHFSISYILPRGVSHLTISLYDLHGRTLWSVIEKEHCSPGKHVITLSPVTLLHSKDYVGSSLASGIYFLSITVSNTSQKIIGAHTQSINLLR